MQALTGFSVENAEDEERRLSENAPFILGDTELFLKVFDLLQLLRVVLARRWYEAGHDDSDVTRDVASNCLTRLLYASKYNCLSKLLYCIASPICSGKISFLSARSAIVLPTFRILSYARALKPSLVIACFSKSSPALST